MNVVLVNWVSTSDYEIMDVCKELPPKKKNYFKTFLKYSPYFLNLIPAFGFFKKMF